MSLRTAPAFVAIAALVAAMVSYQFGASLAKHLFPMVGAEGATAYRLGLSAIILVLLRRRGDHRHRRRKKTGASCGAMASRSAR